MKPIVKYRGGKSRELPLFEELIPKRFAHYIEPFFGGGAVYFHLEPARAILSDVNERLMNFYSQVRDEYGALSGELRSLQELYESNQQLYAQEKASHPHKRVENRNEALYYEMRDMFNGKNTPTCMDGTLYYFINKTAYSGMIRYNRKGEYNVPFGRYRNFNTAPVNKEHNRLLKSAQLYRKDYAEIFSMAEGEDFMFLDPPYDCIFNDYGNMDMENGFDEAQHRRLAADYRNLSCRALMVIGKTPLTDELYRGRIVAQYHKTYAVNIRNRFSADAMHLVVANYRQSG